MRIIVGSRSSGKTKRLLELSAANGIPILCESAEKAARLADKARGYGYRIPTPITLENLTPALREVYVDEIDAVFAYVHGVKVRAATINKEDENDLEDLDV